MADRLWINFVASVWILILYCLLQVFLLFGESDAIRATYGPFSAKVLLWPIAVLVIEGMLWFRVFRYRRDGARAMAAAMGLMLILQPVLVNLLVADLYDRSVDWFRWSVMLYAGLSHLAFAVFGRRV
jgi:hypothetical protein